jgi:hypothetical protein
MMNTRLLVPVLAAMLASSGWALAQDKGASSPPPAKQSAPAESTEASGHDVQAGKPETADKDKGRAGAKKNGNSGSARNTAPK